MAIEQIERLPDVSFIDDDINLDGIPVSYTHLTLPTILRV